MRTRSGLGCLASLMIGLGATSVGNAAPYDAIYAFGDSLTDIGNLLALTSSGSLPGVPPQPVPPIYYIGRRSNGPIWIDYLSGDLGPPISPSLQGGTVFAYASGAETGSTPLHQANFTDLTGPTGQLAQFRQSIPNPDPKALYTLWMGGNDLFDVFYNLGAGGSPNPTAVANASVANMTSFVSAIASLGAKNLLLLTLPDLGKVPVITQDYPSYVSEASALSAYYNQQLVSSLTAEAARDSLNLYVLDVYSLIDAAVADPQRFGFTNVTDPCWTGDFLGQNGTECANPNQYLFWDHYHGTTVTYRILATDAEAVLASVPEPSVFALMALPLVGLAAIRFGPSLHRVATR
ncbi:MAG: SGNH/GDSL hydrolase family protein [Acetobacteraceae bacterium]|nr:SGNH/GDSL hydrolase family protein [Acetobacteraceae bacterium]